jgi:hypothetical protein
MAARSKSTTARRATRMHQHGAGSARSVLHHWLALMDALAPDFRHARPEVQREVIAHLTQKLRLYAAYLRAHRRRRNLP